MAEIKLIQLEEFFIGKDYPARKTDLITQDRKNGADEDVRSTREQLPDQQFQRPADVRLARGELV